MEQAPRQEYEAASRRAGLADLAGRTVLVLTGRDRATLVNNLATNAIAPLASGAGCETFLLDAKGKVLDYVHVFATEEALLVEAEPGRASFLTGHFDKYTITEDVRFENVSETRAVLHLVGPDSPTVLSKAFGLPGEAFGGLGALEHRAIVAGDVEGRVIRRSRSPWLGFDLIFPRDHHAAIRDRLVSAGAEPIGEATVGSLRIEAGLPVFGQEITEDNLAQEIDRNDQAIHFSKGCYIGQETVARLDAMGHVNKILRGLIFEGSDGVATGAELRRDGKAVGRLASHGHSPGLDRWIGLAIVRSSVSKPDTELSVATADGGEISARVTTLPFVDGGS